MARVNFVSDSRSGTAHDSRALRRAGARRRWHDAQPRPRRQRHAALRRGGSGSGEARVDDQCRQHPRRRPSGCAPIPPRITTSNSTHVFAFVIDENGNGIPNVPVRFEVPRHRHGLSRAGTGRQRHRVLRRHGARVHEQQRRGRERAADPRETAGHRHGAARWLRIGRLRASSEPLVDPDPVKRLAPARRGRAGRRRPHPRAPRSRCSPAAPPSRSPAQRREGDMVVLSLKGGGEVGVAASRAARRRAGRGPGRGRACPRDRASRRTWPTMAEAAAGATASIRSSCGRWWRWSRGSGPDAVSPKGAQGLMQLMPATARVAGREGRLRSRRQPRRRHALPADAGRRATAATSSARWPPTTPAQGAVARHGGVPPYRETLAYVRKVLKRAEADGRLRASDAAGAGVRAPRPHRRARLRARHRAGRHHRDDDPDGRGRAPPGATSCRTTASRSCSSAATRSRARSSGIRRRTATPSRSPWKCWSRGSTSAAPTRTR